jgi:hypothetical protein
MGDHGISWDIMGVKGKWWHYCGSAMVFVGPVNGLGRGLPQIGGEC